MIGMTHIGFSYGDRPILTDFSLTLPQKGVLCLTGSSGCGKTTAARLLLGLERPQSGTLTGDRSAPAAVFQEDRLLPWRTALENVALVSPKKAEALLSAVGLPSEAFQKHPAELSGGMRRRVAIARALAADSRFLVLDEPFTGLDGDSRAAIAALIREYAATRPVLLITHQPEEIDLLGADVIKMG